MSVQLERFGFTSAICEIAVLTNEMLLFELNPKELNAVYRYVPSYDFIGLFELIIYGENDKFPFVAVIFPRVAVKVVEAVKDPVTAVLPATKLP